jgi:tetratricopeptide (TPR) repeat protein
MSVVRLGMALALCFLVGGATLAGADGRSLDRLFERLRQTDSSAEAALVERMIWSVWLTYPDDEDGDVRRLMAHAAAAMDRGALAAAERLYSRVVTVAPAFAEGWNKRATVRFARGDTIGSIADIRTVLALEPRHFGALSGLGLCLMRLDRPAQALAAFEQALAVNPHLTGARAHSEHLRRMLAGQAI